MNKTLYKFISIAILVFSATILTSCGNSNKISDTDISSENIENMSYNDTAYVQGSNSQDIKNDEQNKHANIGNSNFDEKQIKTVKPDKTADTVTADTENADTKITDTKTSDNNTIDIGTTNNNTDSGSEEAYDPIRAYELDAAKIDKELMITATNANDTSITLQFNSFEDEEDIHGVLKFRDDIIIEIKNNDVNFSEVPKLSTYYHGMYDDNMHDIDKTSTTEYNFNWESIYGKLEPGNYRLMVRVYFLSSELRSTQDYYKYAYFTVSKN